MSTVGVKAQARRKAARWYVKKHDDKLIERWALACSREHGDCRDCEFMLNCQDLADRLIGCMSVPLTRSWKQRRIDSLRRPLARLQVVSSDAHPPQASVCAHAAALK